MVNRRVARRFTIESRCDIRVFLIEIVGHGDLTGKGAELTRGPRPVRYHIHHGEIILGDRDRLIAVGGIGTHTWHISYAQARINVKEATQK